MARKRPRSALAFHFANIGFGLLALWLLPDGVLRPAAAQSVGKNSAIPKTIARTDTTIDPHGKLKSYQPGGATITANNAFFESLGSNGRSCFSCHRVQEGWSISAAGATTRFKTTKGKDPIFSLSDGATCPSDDVSSLAAMKEAYQLLLGSGTYPHFTSDAANLRAAVQHHFGRRSI
jgi:hypothetical protein